MKRKTAPTRAAKVYQSDDLIPLAAAVELLADRDRRKYDADRQRKARMRQHIRYAVENGDLGKEVRRGKKGYVFGRIAAWAQAKWPGKYDDLPAIRDVIAGSLEVTLPSLTLDAWGYAPPTNLSDCQRELVQKAERIFSLETELRVAREEADRLRPGAEAWRRQCAVNKENAQRPRK